MLSQIRESVQRYVAGERSPTAANAAGLLQESLGPSAEFRAGQLDAIVALGNRYCAACAPGFGSTWNLGYTEVDATYPQRWIQRLGRSAPPVIFGVGEAAHLSIPAIGIVGSRDISRSLMHVADDLGAAFVLGGYAVVSGGARGTDRMGMMGALEVGGVAIAIVPDHLQRDRLRRANLDDIGAQLLTMVTTVHPDAPFTVANAMSRNRLIYALGHDRRGLYFRSTRGHLGWCHPKSQTPPSSACGLE
ncbi:MAG: DNA-processing protein DprA [Thermomicrobiales bacterium]